MSRTALACIVLAAACSGGDSARGSTELKIILGDAATDVTSVMYEIVCDNGESFSDIFEVVEGAGAVISESVRGLPAGGQCTITLTAFDEAGNPICAGSATVTIVENAVVDANIVLICPREGVPDPRGDVNVTGSFQEEPNEAPDCPIIYSLNAVPSMIPDGQNQSSIHFQVLNPDPNNPVLTTTLIPTSGSFVDPNAAAPATFTCALSGDVGITLVASNGNPSCEDSTAVTVVTCPGTGGLCDDAATRCDDFNECTINECDDASGTCSNPTVSDGTSCDGGGGECIAGACEPLGGLTCADAATRCDDLNECTTNECDDASGTCSNPTVSDGTSCDGGGGECIAGVCEPLGGLTCADEATRCDDLNECTGDTCNPDNGQCINVNFGPNVGCAGGGTCFSGVCVPPTASECEGQTDGTSCAAGFGTCVAGICLTASACGDPCDDANECTFDICNEATEACEFEPVPQGVTCRVTGSCDGLGNCSGGL